MHTTSQTWNNLRLTAGLVEGWHTVAQIAADPSEIDYASRQLAAAISEMTALIDSIEEAQ